MVNLKSSPEDTIKLGWATIVLSIIFIVFKNFEWATSFLSIGIILILLGYWRLRYNGNVSVSILSLIAGGLFLSIFISLEIASYMNRQAPKQKICGVVENIDLVQRRGISSSFELVSDRNRQKFSYNEYKNILKTASSLCIEYAFDPHWSNYPYVFEIYQKR